MPQNTFWRMLFHRQIQRRHFQETTCQTQSRTSPAKKSPSTSTAHAAFTRAIACWVTPPFLSRTPRGSGFTRTPPALRTWSLSRKTAPPVPSPTHDPMAVPPKRHRKSTCCACVKTARSRFTPRWTSRGTARICAQHCAAAAHRKTNRFAMAAIPPQILSPAANRPRKKASRWRIITARSRSRRKKTVRFMSKGIWKFVPAQDAR